MMKRRDLLATTATTAALLTIPSMAAHAQAALPKEGTDYLTISPAVAVEAPAGKIEVVEFFWYACPHCNAFEPAFAQWIKAAPKDVIVRRIPVAFRDNFVPLQKLYYTLEAMNLVETFHAKVFHAIHQEHAILDKDELVLAWVNKQPGIDKKKFTEVFKSFTTASKVKAATKAQEAYKIQGVPSFGIHGRYYTEAQLAGSMENVLKTTDYLIAQIRKKV